MTQVLEALSPTCKTWLSLPFPTLVPPYPYTVSIQRLLSLSPFQMKKKQKLLQKKNNIFLMFKKEKSRSTKNKETDPLLGQNMSKEVALTNAEFRNLLGRGWFPSWSTTDQGLLRSYVLHAGWGRFLLWLRISSSFTSLLKHLIKALIPWDTDTSVRLGWS